MPDDSRPLADLHSHLIPGVDDGARTVEDTVEGLARMVERGYGRVLTTPHLDASLTRDPSALEARLEEVREGWEGMVGTVEERWPDLDFRRGFEVMLDVPDADFSDPRLRLGGTRFILVEWPRMQVPPHSTEVLSRLKFAGLNPIIAHPERYAGLDPGLRVVEKWLETGAWLQVNNGSFVGRYGPNAQTVAFRLLKRGWIHYLSSDFHGRPHLSLYMDEAQEELRSRGGEEQLALLARVNPSRVFDDEDPLPVAAVTGETGLWNRIRDLFVNED